MYVDRIDTQVDVTFNFITQSYKLATLIHPDILPIHASSHKGTIVLYNIVIIYYIPTFFADIATCYVACHPIISYIYYACVSE